MPRSVARTYSRYTEETLKLLSVLIRSARLEQKLSASEVAERVGISRSMLQRIEKADPKCEIGAVFEVAVVVGVRLFDATAGVTTLSQYRRQAEDKLVLLPQRARKTTKVVHDDF